jgi:hypothetical protein
MSVESAILLLGVALLLAMIARAIVAGRHGWGSHTIVRSMEPARFHLQLGLLALIILVFAVQYSIEDTRELPWSSLLLGGYAGFHFGKALFTREAIDPAFSRSDEPCQYWLIVAVLLALAAAFLGNFAVTLIAYGA